MPKTFVECKTMLRNGKRKLAYHNSRTNKTLPIVVGKKGGLSIKSPNSKTRRYVKKQCMKNSTKSFRQMVENLKKKK